MAFADRLQWSIDMQQEHALSYYRDHWNNIQKIEEVDAMAENSEEMKWLDFSGIDKIVHTNVGSYHIAQRFRRMRNTEEGLKKPDFSLRIETYNNQATEYQKLKKAYNGMASAPQVYGFGITPYGRQVARDDGFVEFYLIDLEEFLQKHFDDSDIRVIEEKPNGDGSMGAYFSIEEIEENGCIVRKWPSTQKRPEDPTQITNWADG